MFDEKNEDGFYVDEFGSEYGYCNSCGEECPTSDLCCEDGEVVPSD